MANSPPRARRVLRTGMEATPRTPLTYVIRRFSEFKVAAVFLSVNFHSSFHNSGHHLPPGDSEFAVQALTLESVNSKGDGFNLGSTANNNSKQTKLNDMDSEWQPPKTEHSLLGTTTSSDRKHDDAHDRSMNLPSFSEGAPVIIGKEGSGPSGGQTHLKNQMSFDASNLSLHGMMAALSVEDGNMPELQDGNIPELQPHQIQKPQESQVIPLQSDIMSMSGVIPSSNTNTSPIKQVSNTVPDPFEVEQANLVRQYARLYLANPDALRPSVDGMVKQYPRLRADFDRAIAEIREEKRKSTEGGNREHDGAESDKDDELVGEDIDSKGKERLDRETFVKLRKELKQRRKAERKMEQKADIHAKQQVQQPRKSKRLVFGALKQCISERNAEKRESKRVVFGALKQYAYERKNVRRELEQEEKERFQMDPVSSITNKTDLQAFGIVDPAVVEVIPLSEQNRNGEGEADEQECNPEHADPKDDNQAEKTDAVKSCKSEQLDSPKANESEKGPDLEEDPNISPNRTNFSSSSCEIADQNRVSEKRLEEVDTDMREKEEKIEEKFGKMTLLNDEEGVVGEKQDAPRDASVDMQPENHDPSPKPKKKRKNRKKRNKKSGTDKPDLNTEKAEEEKVDPVAEKSTPTDERKPILHSEKSPNVRADRIEENLNRKKQSDPNAWQQTEWWVDKIGGALEGVRQQKIEFQWRLERIGKLLKAQDEEGKEPVKLLLSAKKKEAMKTVVDTYQQLVKQLEQREALQSMLVKTIEENSRKQNSSQKQGDRQKAVSEKEKVEQAENLNPKDLSTSLGRAQELIEAEVKARILKLNVIHNLLSSDLGNLEIYCAEVEEVLGRFNADFHGSYVDPPSSGPHSDGEHPGGIAVDLISMSRTWEASSIPAELRKEIVAGTGRFQGDETYAKVDESMMELHSSIGTMREHLVWIRDKVRSKVLASFAEKAHVLKNTLLVDRTEEAAQGKSKVDVDEVPKPEYGNDIWGLCTDFSKGTQRGGRSECSEQNQIHLDHQMNPNQPRLLQKKLSAETRTRARSLSFLVENTVELWKSLRERMLPVLVECLRERKQNDMLMNPGPDKNNETATKGSKNIFLSNGNHGDEEDDMQISNFLSSVITEGEGLSLRGPAKETARAHVKLKPKEEEKHQQPEKPHVAINDDRNTTSSSEFGSREGRYLLWRQGFYLAGSTSVEEVKLRELEGQAAVRRRKARDIFSEEMREMLWERFPKVMRVGDILFCDGEFSEKKAASQNDGIQMSPPEQTKKVIRI